MTPPIPLSITTNIAFDADHESVAEALLDAETESTQAGGGGGGGVEVTVMVVAHVTVPPGPVAVPVYVVLVVGDTDFVPPATGVTLPILLFIENEVAFAVVHERVEDEPV